MKTGTTPRSSGSSEARPKARSLELSLVARTTETTGRVRITGTLVHSGPPFRSSPGQQSLRLYEVSAEGHADQVAARAFEDLDAGDTVTVTYERNWDAAMEFAPSYQLRITYDPDIFIDGNEENDDCNLDNNGLDRAGVEVSALFD